MVILVVDFKSDPSCIHHRELPSVAKEYTEAKDGDELELPLVPVSTTTFRRCIFVTYSQFLQLSHTIHIFLIALCASLLASSNSACQFDAIAGIGGLRAILHQIVVHISAAYR